MLVVGCVWLVITTSTHIGPGCWIWVPQVGWMVSLRLIFCFIIPWLALIGRPAGPGILGEAYGEGAEKARMWYRSMGRSAPGDQLKLTRTQQRDLERCVQSVVVL